VDASANNPIPHSVGILIFDDVEVLDFCGPFEVFSVAARLTTSDQHPEQPAFHVFTVAEHDCTIVARGNLLIQPHFTIETAPVIDLLIVPGGWGTRREVTNDALIGWIASVAQHTAITASVCTGAFLLAQAGLLADKAATTHWASLDRFAKDFPAVRVQRETRWVDEGKIITSAGISAGIDMSLHIVACILGREHAVATARQMEYTWVDTP
jgi:transcriptional regulator GlxA family with amidase domain